MALCPNCGYLTIIKPTQWKCKRCSKQGPLDPKFHKKDQIQAQMNSQVPNPEMKYPEAYRQEQGDK